VFFKAPTAATPSKIEQTHHPGNLKTILLKQRDCAKGRPSAVQDIVNKHNWPIPGDGPFDQTLPSVRLSFFSNKPAHKRRMPSRRDDRSDEGIASKSKTHNLIDVFGP
jgi:hypothetical protein